MEVLRAILASAAFALVGLVLIVFLTGLSRRNRKGITGIELLEPPQPSGPPEPHPYRHIFLYAKDRYRRGNMMEDLRILVGHITAIVPEHVRDEDILEVVHGVAFEQMLKRGTSERIQLGIYSEILRVTRKEDRPPRIQDIVENLLAILTITRVRTKEKEILLNLGEPDYELLPRNIV